MEAKPMEDLTLILGRARAGDHRARGDLVALVYDELREVATRLMRNERPDHTLSPTAVVHEAVIRLLGKEVFDRAADRSFLFASVARAMRAVLIDHARLPSVAEASPNYTGGLGWSGPQGRTVLDRPARFPPRRMAQSSGPNPAPLRASVESTEALGKRLRRSMHSVRLSPSTRERLPDPNGPW